MSGTMRRNSMSQLLLDIAPASPPTLDNFVVGRNLELLSALRHALFGNNGAGGSERCFYLWGESRQRQEPSAASLRACSPGCAITSAIYARGSVPPQAVGMDAAVVAVDDVEQLDDTAQIELFNLYNRMRESGGMLLVSGKESALHLKLRDDLRTRLGWGLVYQVHGLSDEEKALALSQHAQAKGLRPAAGSHAISVAPRQARPAQPDGGAGRAGCAFVAPASRAFRAAAQGSC